MASTGQSSSSAGVDVLRFLLIALAAVFVIGGASAAILQFLAPAPGTTQSAQVVAALAILLGSLTVAFVLLAMATALRLLHAQLRQLAFTQHTTEQLRQSVLLLQETTAQIPQQLAAIPPVTPPSRESLAGTDTAQVVSSDQLVDLLTQLRDLMLMSEAQRLERGRQHWERRRESLTRLIDQHVAAKEWRPAESLVQELMALAPDELATQALAQHIRTAQAQQLFDAIAAARTKLRHLMSISAWMQADEVVRILRRDFPGAPEVQAVADELAHEREAFDKENLQRLFADLKDASEHRQWRRAYQTAEELILRYPHEKKVEKLKAEGIGTIKENADAQERREQEELFKDLLKRQRYEDALGVATAVINKFPTSTAAVELNRLIPKVEELIRQDQMKRQQGTPSTPA